MKTSKLIGRVPMYEDAFELLRLYPSDKIIGTPGDDSLTGTEGKDKIDGGAGNDTMVGGNGKDTYYVDSAGDVIVEAQDGGKDKVFASVSYTLGEYVDNLTLTGSAFGGTGNADKNVIRGNADTNLLYGLAGNDYLDGGEGDDILYGGAGRDDLRGGIGNDVLDGEAGTDNLQGGAGDDTIGDYDAQGGETFGGGDGIDKLDTSWWKTADDIVWINDPTQTQVVAGDTVSGFEVLDIGTGSGDDLIDVGGGLWGWIYAGSGNDTLLGGALHDALYGAEGNDSLRGRDGNDRLQGDEGLDVLIGGGGNDTLYGGVDADRVSGDAGDDYIVHDFVGSPVGDTYAGDDGNDTLDALWLGTTEDIVWINDPTQTQVVAGTTVSGFEVLDIQIGSGDDLVDVGGGLWATIYAGNGNDTLIGGAQADELDGGAGNNSLTGGGGNDTLKGWSGSDSLLGGAGDDWLVDYSFDDSVVDTYAGGDGTDTLSVYGRSATEDIVWINDPTQTQVVLGHTISGCEVLAIQSGKGDDLLDIGGGLWGSFFGYGGNDTLIGGALKDELSGGGDNDSLIGKAGKDTLNGGDGLDTLIGGIGADILIGGSGADLYVCGDPTAADRVDYFERALDKLAIAQSAYSVGDGDTAVEGASTIGGPGGFAASAELVVNTQDLGRDITAEKAAAAMGSASSSYALGQTAIFVVRGEGTRGEDMTAVYGFESTGTDGLVSAAELTLLCTMQTNGASTTVGDYLFVG